MCVPLIVNNNRELNVSDITATMETAQKLFICTLSLSYLNEYKNIQRMYTSILPTRKHHTFVGSDRIQELLIIVSETNSQWNTLVHV